MRLRFFPILFFWLMFCPALAVAGPIAVIVNKANPVSKETIGNVRSMYEGTDINWPQGGRIKLVNREVSSPIRVEFYQKVMMAAPDQQFYRAGVPVVVQSIVQRSDEAVIRFVASVEGAVGYVPVLAVNESVKVILTIE